MSIESQLDVEPRSPDSLVDDMGTNVIDMIKQRIRHVLGIWPKLSPSMLQVGIGTGIAPALWHPVLEQMVVDGEINKTQIKETNPVTKRDQVYTVITKSAT